MSDQLDAAQASVDTAWTQHEDYRAPLRDTLRSLVESLSGVTGMGPGPGSDRLVDLFLDFGEQHSDDFKNASGARAVAVAQQEARDEVLANEPPPAEPEPDAPPFTDLDDDVQRAWLRGATDQEVREVLSGVPTTDEQRALATQLMRWGRADGNQAQVFAAINEFLVEPNDATVDPGEQSGGTGATSTYPQQIPESASSEDEPITGDETAAVPPDGDEVLEWLDETQGPEVEPAPAPDAPAPPADAPPASEPAPETVPTEGDSGAQPAADVEVVVDQPTDG